jgi:toxin ParE1/3/4
LKPFCVRYRPQAEADLDAIHDWLLRVASHDRADAYVDRIIAHCDSFADLPHRGTMRDDLSPGLRTTSWRKRLTIGFRVFETEREVAIIFIAWRGRNIDDIAELD